MKDTNFLDLLNMPIITLILGFILGAIASCLAWVRDIWKERGQRKAARTLISIEIDQNLALLKDCWGKVKELDQPEGTPEVRALRLTHRLLSLPTPAWKHRALESQMQILADVLSSSEIERIFELYDHLDKMSDIRVELGEISRKRQQQPGVIHDGTPHTSLQRMIFFAQSQELSDRTAELWSAFDHVANQMLEQGNPLRRSLTMHPLARVLRLVRRERKVSQPAEHTPQADMSQDLTEQG